MERTIGMDVHAASCTLAVIPEKGRRLKDFPVETNGQALVKASCVFHTTPRSLIGSSQMRHISLVPDDLEDAS